MKKVEKTSSEITIFGKNILHRGPPMSNQKNPFAAHLERKNDTGKCIVHFREKYPNTSALTQLAAASLHRRVCCLPRRVCADASAPTRLRRRVRADASTPRRLHRRVCSDRSGPTRLCRRVCADASAPTRLRRRVCAEAPAPRCLLRPVRADASIPTGLRQICGPCRNGKSLRKVAFR